MGWPEAFALVGVWASLCAWDIGRRNSKITGLWK
jgi:hypothetical protein